MLAKPDGPSLEIGGLVAKSQFYWLLFQIFRLPTLGLCVVRRLKHQHPVLYHHVVLESWSRALIGERQCPHVENALRHEEGNLFISLRKEAILEDKMDRCALDVPVTSRMNSPRFRV